MERRSTKAKGDFLAASHFSMLAFLGVGTL
jgi:hypothetical protein